MPRISRYNRDTHKLEWVDATEAEAEEWRAKRRAKASAGAIPKGGSKARKGRAGRRSPAEAAPHEHETLEDIGTEAAASVGAAAGKPKASGGPLAPVIGLLARLGGIGLIRVTATLTAGRHPMSPAEAMSVATPALRIVDRELGKRVKFRAAGGPNAADAGRIGMGITSWILRGMAGAQTAPAQSAPMYQPAPAMQAEPAPDLAAEPDLAASDAADDGDLFSGSEPVAQGARAAVGSTPAIAQRPAAGPPGAVRNVPESVWNQLSPTDIGLAEVMA